MGNFLERQHAWETNAAGESLPDRADGRQGGWSSCAPAFRLILAAMVGPRPLETAKEAVAATTARVLGGPACLCDGFTCSLAARIAACHGVTTLARTGKRGRPRTPRGEPHPAVVYGPLVTPKPQGKLLTRSARVVLGTTRLTQLGYALRTAVVEGVNLTLKQALAPLARQTWRFCKDRERLRQRGAFARLSTLWPAPTCACSSRWRGKRTHKTH